MTLDQFLTEARPYFEFLYSLSGLLLAAIAIYGIQQIRLMKADMRMRAERNAKEKAIEACSDYMSTYIPLGDKFYSECVEKKMSSYKGPIGDFTPESVPQKHKTHAVERFAVGSWRFAFNKRESIAAFFVSGVADETIGFRVIGKTFCANVESDYDIIASCRHEKTTLYWWDNTVKLYNVWSSRLTRTALDIARKEIEARIEVLPEQTIPPIGVNPKDI